MAELINENIEMGIENEDIEMNNWVQTWKENREKRNELDYTIFKNNEFDRKKCPDNISLETLEFEIGLESTFYTIYSKDDNGKLIKDEKSTKNLLWEKICHIILDLDELGFYYDKQEKQTYYPIIEKTEKEYKIIEVKIEIEKNDIKNEIVVNKPVGGKQTSSKSRKSKSRKSKSRKSRKSRKSKKYGGTAFNQLNYTDNAVIPLNFRRSPTMWWHTITKLNNLNMYGSSLPKFQFDGVGNQNTESNSWDAYKNFIYFLSVLNIRRIISLQGCGDDRIRNADGSDRAGVSNNRTCRNNHDPVGPYGNEWEDDFFINAKTHLEGLNPEFTGQANLNAIEFRNITINDMAVGSTNAWVRLAQVPDTNALNNPNGTLVHCYAGFGRTGAALLFYMMRDNINYHQGLNHADGFLGLGSSAIMYNTLRDALSQQLQYTTQGDPIQQQHIRRYNKQEGVNEVFQIHTVMNAILFVARINNILFCVGTVRGIQNIPIYRIPTTGCTPDTIFQVARRVATPNFTNVVANPWQIPANRLRVEI